MLATLAVIWTQLRLKTEPTLKWRVAYGHSRDREWAFGGVTRYPFVAGVNVRVSDALT